ncbi:MAG: ABC transporter ATP-binding protein [Bacteroidota bacterium]
MDITASNIRFSYKKDIPVLNGINFNVNDGEILGILGSSGCGKSTLLRIICGLIRNGPKKGYSGSIMLNGNEDTFSLRKNGKIGFMFQERSLLPNLTLEKNISLPTQMNIGLNVHKYFSRELIELVGLEDFKDYLPRELSGGMQTRAELARAFITKPNLILLDEPFSSLDYGWKMDLYSKVFNLIMKFQSTAIIVSHDIQELVLLADRIIMISKTGEIVNKDFLTTKESFNYTSKNMQDFLFEKANLIHEIQSKFLED